jgi:hypothetical protein
MSGTAISTKNHFLLLLGVSLYGHVLFTPIPALLAKLGKNLPPLCLSMAATMNSFMGNLTFFMETSSFKGPSLATWRGI